VLAATHPAVAAQRRSAPPEPAATGLRRPHLARAASRACRAAQKRGEVTKWPSGVSMQLLAIRAESRGSVRLAGDGGIASAPAIDLAYLSDAAGADAATLRAGLRLSRRLADSPAWKGMLEKELHPGRARDSDADLDAYVKETLHSGNALVGTCAMGADVATGGVVSPEDLRVHGVAGVRVVDSSVLPRIPGGQTGAPTVMVAVRAASMITQGRESVAGAAVPELVAA
jgi:fatty acid photodecarboxylase